MLTIVYRTPYFFFLSSSKRRDRSSKSISSSLLFPSEFGTSGKSNGTFGKLDKSSLTDGGAEADGGGGDIFDLGCGFGVLFKFCGNENQKRCSLANIIYQTTIDVFLARLAFVFSCE